MTIKGNRACLLQSDLFTRDFTEAIEAGFRANYSLPQILLAFELYAFQLPEEQTHYSSDKQ